MAVRVLTADDLDWAVELLAERRSALLPFAPLFWKPSEHAARHHRAFLDTLLTGGAGHGFRTGTGVLIAARRAPEWTVDDMYVPNGRWGADSDAAALWAAFGDEHGGDQVRMVCPVYEQQRTNFTVRNGLILANTWWLLELPGSGGGIADETLGLPGAAAFTTGAPPVYSPPGPMLFLAEVSEPRSAIPAAVAEAPRCGCAGIVVNHRPDDDALGATLRAAGFRPHCGFYSGVLNSIRDPQRVAWGHPMPYR